MVARLAVAIALSVHVLASAQSRDVLVAVDLGTHLDPIARFDGSTWTPVPKGLGSAAPREWTRWPAPGPSLTIRLSATEPAGRCEAPRRLTVASPPARPSDAFDQTYVGIATSGTASRDSLRRLGEGSQEWKAVTAGIAPVFERRQQATGVSAASLARVPMTVDSAYAAGSGVALAYYFEASKRIPDAGNTPPEDPKGVVRISVSGWLRAADSGLRPGGTKSELLWAQENDPATRLPALVPLGVVRQGDERVWVMKGRVGTRDTFTLYALRGSLVRTLFTVDAAAC